VSGRGGLNHGKRKTPSVVFPRPANLGEGNRLPDEQQWTSSRSTIGWRPKEGREDDRGRSRGPPLSERPAPAIRRDGKPRSSRGKKAGRGNDSANAVVGLPDPRARTIHGDHGLPGTTVKRVAKVLKCTENTPKKRS